MPLQVPPTTQQPPPQKRERKPLAIVDPNTNEEVTKSRESVSRSRSESTSEVGFISAWTENSSIINVVCVVINVVTGFGWSK